jgi:pSer/pThr/pTyr-binding forkhead associated (FHA) protein
MQLKIGRTQNNDIIINKENVSSHHANLLILEDHIIIEDMDSTNGVWVNRRRVEKCLIDPSDEILIGNHFFEFNKYLKRSEGRIVGAKRLDDYTDHFNNLVEIEAIHESEMHQITKNANKAMMLFRASFLVTAVSGMGMRYFLGEGHSIYIIISTILLGLMSLFFFNRLQKSNEIREKEKKKLREHFKVNFICPSCGNHIPDTIYLMKLKDEYNCKFCKVLIYKK